MKVIYTAIIFSIITLAFSLDVSAQRNNRAQNNRSSTIQNRGSLISVSVDPTTDTPQRVRSVSGRISGIAVDPSDPSGNTVYLNSTNGVVRRNRAAGSTLVNSSTTTNRGTARSVEYSRVGPDIHGN